DPYALGIIGAPFQRDAFANEGHVAVDVETLDARLALLRLGVVDADGHLAALLTAVILGHRQVVIPRVAGADLALADAGNALIFEIDRLHVAHIPAQRGALPRVDGVAVGPEVDAVARTAGDVDRDRELVRGAIVADHTQGVGGRSARADASRIMAGDALRVAAIHQEDRTHV